MMVAERTGQAGQAEGQTGRYGAAAQAGQTDRAGPGSTSETQARAPQSAPYRRLLSRLCPPWLCDPRIWQLALILLACILFGILIKGPEPATSPVSEASAPVTAEEATPRVCDRLGCVVTAAQTVRFVNRSVDPCGDFFHFACGRFDEAHPSGTRTALGVRDVLRRRNQARLLQLLSHRQRYNSSSAVSKARYFFFTCTAAFSASLNGVPRLVRLLQPLGGLDLLNTWRPNQWDFNTVLSNASRLHLTQAFFTLTWDRWNDVLEVQLPKLALDFVHSWDVENGRYHAVEARVGRAMREVFHQLEQDSGVLLHDGEMDDSKTPRACSLNRSNKSTNNLISPCVDEIVRDILSVQGELYGINPQRSSQARYTPPEKVSLTEMRQLVPQIDWRHLLDALFGAGAVHGSVSFLVPSREHMAAVGRIIENTRVKRLHHFLMWPVIRRYLPALGPVYATLGEELDRNYDAEQLKTREEQCLELMDEHMAPALHALLLSVHIGHDSAPHVRKHLLNDTIRVLNDSFGWMSESTQRQSRAALKYLKVRFGFTELLKYKEALDAYYSPLEFNMTFFNNLQALYDFNRPGKIKNEFPTKEPPESVKIRYDLVHGTLWVPFGALQAPWYHKDVPAALNAASLGSLIFEALAVPFIQLHLSPQNLTEIWDVKTEDRFEHFYNCLLEKVRARPIRQELSVLEPARSGLRFAAYSMRVDPVPATYFMLADHFAYELSYRLYQRLTANNTEPTALPGLPTNNSNQAFFLAFTQARCRNDYALWDESLIGASKTLQVPESYVINQLFLADPRFREAFQCGPLSAGGADSETRRCSLF